MNWLFKSMQCNILLDGSIIIFLNFLKPKIINILRALFCTKVLFSNYSLALWLFGKIILAKKADVKCWWNWYQSLVYLVQIPEIDTRNGLSFFLWKKAWKFSFLPINTNLKLERAWRDIQGVFFREQANNCTRFVTPHEKRALKCLEAKVFISLFKPSCHSPFTHAFFSQYGFDLSSDFGYVIRDHTQFPSWVRKLSSTDVKLWAGVSMLGQIRSYKNFD